MRSLRARICFAVTQSTLDPLPAFGLSDEDKQFFLTGCDVIGINNLPKDFSERIAKTLGAVDLPALASTSPDQFPVDNAAPYRQAASSG